jgi:hypothetical protein
VGAVNQSVQSIRLSRAKIIVAVKMGAVGFVMFILLNDKAYAYLDPGTASLFMNAVLAAVAGAAVSIGECWARLKRLLSLLLAKLCLKSAPPHAPSSAQKSSGQYD